MLRLDPDGVVADGQGRQLDLRGRPGGGGRLDPPHRERVRRHREGDGVVRPEAAAEAADPDHRAIRREVLGRDRRLHEEREADREQDRGVTSLEVRIDPGADDAPRGQVVRQRHLHRAAAVGARLDEPGDEPVTELAPAVTITAAGVTLAPRDVVERGPVGRCPADDPRPDALVQVCEGVRLLGGAHREQLLVDRADDDGRRDGRPVGAPRLDADGRRLARGIAIPVGCHRDGELAVRRASGPPSTRRSPARSPTR